MRVGEEERQEQDALERGQDPDRRSTASRPGTATCSPIATAAQAATCQRRSPLVRAARRFHPASGLLRRPEERGAGLSTRRATACRVHRAAGAATSGSGLLTSATSTEWPADGGEPDLTGHTDDNLTRIRTHPPAGSRSPAGDHPDGADVVGGHRAARHDGEYPPQPAGPVPGQDAGRRPGGCSGSDARKLSPPSPACRSPSGGTEHSRCRTQAKSAGRTDRRLGPDAARSGVTPNCGRQTEHPDRHVAGSRRRGTSGVPNGGSARTGSGRAAAATTRSWRSTTRARPAWPSGVWALDADLAAAFDRLNHDHFSRRSGRSPAGRWSGGG